ncbi:hypothetical protein Tco_0133639 [Tanacetum coccineum]
MARSDDENPPPPPPPQTPTQQAPHSVSTIKLPILKKGEYDVWAMKMEHYLSRTNYPIWEVIQKGNGPDAIKSRFGGNDESKKMQKYILKQQFEGFSVSNSQGLHKGYDRFQSLLIQLEIHGVGVSTKDANQRLLRSLPLSWSHVSLVMRTKPGVDSLSFDDLYNNLRVFESDVKDSTGSSSNAQNVAFVSSESTSSTNDVSTAYGVSTSSGYNSQKENSSSYTDELIRVGLEMASTHDFNKIEDVLQEDRSKYPLSMKDQTSGVDSLSFDDLYNNLRVFEYDVKDSTRSSSNAQLSLLCYFLTALAVLMIVETLESVPEPVVVEPKVISQPKVWSDAPSLKIRPGPVMMIM